MVKAILKSRRILVALLIVTIAAMLYALLEIERLDGYFQRVYLPPAQTQAAPAEDGKQSEKKNGSLNEALLAIKELNKVLEGACEGGTLYATAQPAAISIKDKAGVDARLVGVNDGYFDLHPLALHCGRLLYPEELRLGERVAVVDEQLAVALFQYAEPLNQEILIEGQKYRIVGVTLARKQVGDEMNYSLYVPYRALENSSLTLTSLVYEARPVKGAGGWSAFESATSSLGRGTTISLSKERTNAALPLRMLTVLCGAAVGFFFLKCLNRRFSAVARRYRALLRDRYAASLLWWAFWRGALLTLGYAACIFALAQLFVLLIAPVYTFPEWIPAVLVEPKDIQAAFWNVWQKSSSVLELRTPELLRLRFFRELMGWSAGAAALILGALWGRTTQAAAPEKILDASRIDNDGKPDDSIKHEESF